MPLSKCPTIFQHVQGRWADSMVVAAAAAVVVVVVGFRCLRSQRHASVTEGRICPNKCTCCHTEIEVADQTFHLTRSQYTATGPTSPSADPAMAPGVAATGVPISRVPYQNGVSRL